MVKAKERLDVYISHWQARTRLMMFPESWNWDTAMAFTTWLYGVIWKNHFHPSGTVSSVAHTRTYHTSVVYTVAQHYYYCCQTIRKASEVRLRMPPMVTLVR